jgi:adenosylcobinamide-phosphate synthase
VKRSTLWLAAMALDGIAGEPPAQLHPVVVAGRLISALEGTHPAESTRAFRRGLLLVAVPMGVACSLGWLVEHLRPAWLRAIATVWLLKSSFALRGLLDAGARTERALARSDLDAARAEVRALVSRPVDRLDGGHLTSAVIESLAENLCDSYVAPLCWFAVGGLPAALAYRVVNTADAMVGYHGRYEYLGKAAARLDDFVNVVPARLSALSLAAAAPLMARSGREAVRIGWRDHRLTESPNAGWPMAAAAGALGVWLEKPGAYRLGVGDRPPTIRDASAARRLVLAAVGVVTLAYVALDRRRG